MAASYTWPPSLPQKPLNGSFSANYGFNIIRTNTDSGVAKMRKRGERGNSWSMSFLMTDTQVATLATFVDTSLDGVARFYFDDPRTGTTEEVRLVPSSDGALYSVSHNSNGYYNVSVNMEVMP